MSRLAEALAARWRALPARARGALGWLAGGLAVWGLSLLYFWPAPRVLGSRLLGHHIDRYYALWSIEWVLRQRFGLAGPLFDANLQHPHGTTLCFSDTLIGQALLALPLHLAGASPALTYNLLLTAGTTLSALAAYALARELVAHRAAALVALVGYGFVPAHAAGVNHVNLQYTFGLPLALLGLVLATRRGRVGGWYLAGLAMVAQAYFSTQVALWQGLGLALVAPWWLALHPGWRRGRALAHAGVATLLSLLLVAPLGAAYLRLGRELGFARSMRETVFYSGSLRALRSDRDLLRWDFFADNIPNTELGYLGIGLVALALAGVLVLLARLVRPGRRDAAAWLGSGLVLVVAGGVLFLGPVFKDHGDGPLPFWWLREHLGVLRGVRVPARAIDLSALGLAWLAVAGVHALIARLRWAWLRVAVPVALAAALFVLFVPHPVAHDAPRDPSPVVELASQLPADAVVLPWPAFRDYHLSAFDTYDAAFHGRALVGGYTGIFSWLYRALYLELAELPAGRSLEVAAALGTTHLVADTRVLDAKRREALAAAIAGGQLLDPGLTQGGRQVHALARPGARILTLDALRAAAPLPVVAGARVEAGSYATSALEIPATLAEPLRVNPTQTWAGRVALACPHGRVEGPALLAAPPIVDAAHRLLAFSYRAPAPPGRCALELRVDDDVLGKGTIEVEAPGRGPARARVEVDATAIAPWAHGGLALTLRIDNLGEQVLRARSDVGWPPFRGEFQVECRLDGPRGETQRVAAEWGNGALHADLAPGESAQRQLRLRAPRGGGTYALRCRPVLAHVGFVGDFGARRELEVVP